MMKIALFMPLFLLGAVCRGQFTHPGMLDSQEELEFVRQKVANGEEPWTSAFEEMKKADMADLRWQAKPVDVVVIGYYSKPNVGGTDMWRDGDAAYTMALRWYISQDKAYAEKAIEILNAWSTTMDSITHDNRKWHLGTAGIKFLNAAEIIKHTYKGWKKKDQQAFSHLALNVWFPVLESFQPDFNGNWDAAIMQTMMSIGIFLDRQDIFDKAYNHCLSGHSLGAIGNYYNEMGQCQESGRDQNHAQLGLGFMSAVCETAWNQGKDLYGAYDDRLARGFEYTSKYMIGDEVEYVPYKTYTGEIVFPDGISSQGRGKFSPVYERGYRHYHYRMGLDMPYTEMALEKSSPEYSGGTLMPWSTLMNHGYTPK